MINERIYLDHNASSTLRPKARDAMIKALDQHGNASSVHGEGRKARRLVEDAREQVAALVGAKPAEVVFTSGATEANNMAIAHYWDSILVADIEHESVLMPAKASQAERVRLPVSETGQVDAGGLAESLLLGPELGHALLSVQMANNETGVLQDVAGLVDFASAHGVATHTDAVQACGRIDVDFQTLAVDMLSLSSHKIGGPMGVGALVIRDGFQLPSLLRGGGQERRRRAGTEGVAAIAGFGAAAEVALSEIRSEAWRLSELRDRAEAELLTLVDGAQIIGAGSERLPNTTCIALPGELSETTVIKLDLAGVAISAGSACSSGKVGASHVLSAMGLPPEIARSAIRISLGWNTSESSLEEFLTRFRRLLAGPAKAVA